MGKRVGTHEIALLRSADATKLREWAGQVECEMLALALHDNQPPEGMFGAQALLLAIAELAEDGAFVDGCDDNGWDVYTIADMHHGKKPAPTLCAALANLLTGEDR